MTVSYCLSEGEGLTDLISWCRLVPWHLYFQGLVE